MRVSALAFAAVLSVCTSGAAAARPIVVELFTSEGCSSCPPADALLTELSGRSDLLPLAFHVTYWNALGWRDPYSFDEATRRQADYAGRLGGGSYTPEMVVEGRRGMVGSERSVVAAAIAAAKAVGPQPAVMLTRAPDGVAIAIEAGGERGRILLVGFDPRRETHIGRGENGGRTLVESNIVRSMRRVGDYDGTARRLTAKQGDGAAFAVIVQAADGRIVGAGRL